MKAASLRGSMSQHHLLVHRQLLLVVLLEEVLVLIAWNARLRSLGLGSGFGVWGLRLRVRGPSKDDGLFENKKSCLRPQGAPHKPIKYTPTRLQFLTAHLDESPSSPVSEEFSPVSSGRKSCNTTPLPCSTRNDAPRPFFIAQHNPFTIPIRSRLVELTKGSQPKSKPQEPKAEAQITEP